MHQDRSIEQNRADRVAPQAVEPGAARLHRLDRDEAQGVIAEMGEEKSAEHEACHQTDLAAPDRDL